MSVNEKKLHAPMRQYTKTGGLELRFVNSMGFVKDALVKNKQNGDIFTIVEVGSEMAKLKLMKAAKSTDTAKHPAADIKVEKRLQAF